jgi:hypothetical protein
VRLGALPAGMIPYNNEILNTKISGSNPLRSAKTISGVGSSGRWRS